ncbi:MULTISPECIES: sigma-54 interaction domain-containing protein [Clostridium]|uniref:Arginine utilization regulatory protein RocR n=4 Tax=Clostridium TaxID=1485 RepID=D8GRG6_CLOLD|nr:MULTISPECIES: sigma 54-interacting transcriptional regulator [Clostridium]ADK16334.1 predicted two-component response regulator [Clostridium ljungdahlii DSM 13528]AGY75411.1 sigma 54-interacting transcriptional regulator [Clostridium autoethanogenum DSM 10061]ALU35577.1 Sigma-54 specific transcriptional regulator Fis family [Clostridium autoethanogenum DSM 10061]OAA89792.1 Arginine utilization regulatory protein RocR [Clostridium ljungdahlii DSM 13528]OAA94683.1 Arginine utilization regulat
MISIDIMLFIDNDNVLRHVKFGDLTRTDKRIYILKKYIGNEITSFLDVDLKIDSGYIKWGELFLRYFKTENFTGKGYILYITQAESDEDLYRAAFDCLSEGMQIYDKNAHLVFCNKFNEKIEKMDRRNIIGKHLLDIYSLEEDYSTILNTMKKGEAIVDRCDNFKNNKGEIISTMNSGYPLFLGSNLIGAVGLVQDVSVFQKYREKAAIFKNFIDTKKSNKYLKSPKKYYALKYYNFDDIIGKDENFLEAINLACNVAERDCSVLIYGETGTGKELFAQSIHSASKRKYKEFIAVNCAAIPENLVEGILFGTEKGAFTGSYDKKGLFEQAEGGTLFLDEINSMSLQMQSKLLRVLQEKSFRRVGGSKDIESNVRIISSTNEKPFSLIKNGKMRSDLYYRISTITINIPPLRERKKDIELLAQLFMKKLCRNYSKNINVMSDEVIKVFKEYDWPGNVRELQHCIEYIFNTITEDTIYISDLPQYMKKKANRDCKKGLQHKTLEQILNEYEREVIKTALRKNKNNVTNTAKYLGMKRQSLQYRMKKYGL